MVTVQRDNRLAYANMDEQSDSDSRILTKRQMCQGELTLIYGKSSWLKDQMIFGEIPVGEVTGDRVHNHSVLLPF